MKLRHLLMGTAIALALPATAIAQTPTEGFYVGAQAGKSWVDSTEFSVLGISNEVEFESAWTGVVEAGYRFAQGFRLGVEVGYASHDVDGITGGPAGRTGGAGELALLSYMGVGYIDFDAGNNIRPYIGGGLGLLQADLDNVGPSLGLNTFINSDTDKFAYQLGAGVGYAVSPNLELSVGYRFLTADGIEVAAAGTRPSFNYDVTSHSVLVGLRYTFGAPPAPPPPPVTPAAAPAQTPPPPPPPPAITRNFMVFFDFDKSDLTPDARQVLDNVAAEARNGRITAVQVTGHADRSGSDEYNQRLSVRRAEAVREYLVGLGLGAGQIAIDGKGETEPMVPTADGVREPSNRRAVIIFP